MRMPRLKESTDACYHVISRIVDRQRLLDRQEKERLRRFMRQMEGFSGVEVLTYALLGNHFHLLLHVPQRRAVSDEELIERLGWLYEPARVRAIAEALGQLRQHGDHQAAEQLKARYSSRMYELSEFCKTLKQRFSQSYNRRHRRKGTLWEERFKSVLVEGRGRSLAATAAYIDMNAVRAGLVSDPKDYRFCGYGEAMGGAAAARRGIEQLSAASGAGGGWRAAAAAYRKALSVEAAGSEGTAGPGFDRSRVAAVLAQGGALSVQQLLRCRVRYFTDGVVLGGRGYVEEVLRRHRDRFGTRRLPRPQPVRGWWCGQLYTARRLQSQAITLPAIG